MRTNPPTAMTIGQTRHKYLSPVPNVRLLSLYIADSDSGNGSLAGRFSKQGQKIRPAVDRVAGPQLFLTRQGLEMIQHTMIATSSIASTMRMTSDPIVKHPDFSCA